MVSINEKTAVLGGMFEISFATQPWLPDRQTARLLHLAVGMRTGSSEGEASSGEPAVIEFRLSPTGIFKLAWNMRLTANLPAIGNHEDNTTGGAKFVRAIWAPSL